MASLNRKRCNGPCSPVIPTEVEEWSEWDERHGRQSREGSGEENRETNEFNLSLLLKYLEMSPVRLAPLAQGTLSTWRLRRWQMDATSRCRST
jgi:hypothetical protein